MQSTLQLRVRIKLHSYRRCVFQFSPFFEGAASLNCYLIKRVPKEEKERRWGEDVRPPQRLAYSPRPRDPNSQFEGVDLYFSEVNSLWWYKYTSNGKHSFFVQSNMNQNIINHHSLNLLCNIVSGNLNVSFNSCTCEQFENWIYICFF